MRKVLARRAIAGACFLAVAAACFAVLIFGLEYDRVQGLCRPAASRVASVGEAIDAVRNYRMEEGVVGRMLAAVRQTDAFQRDGYDVQTKDEGGYRYREGGGWHVETWTTPLNRGYTVTFEYFSLAFNPEIEVTCVVYDCGGIDIPNCLTLGSINVPAPGTRTWISPTTG